MARQISPQRRKIAAMSGAVAAIGGSVIALHNHPYLRHALLVFMVLAVAYLIREMVKLKRVGNWC
jgi:uncharacterized membrane protein YccC